MKQIKIVPPARDHLVRIADHMNPLDVQEVWASGGCTPLEALESSVDVSYSSRVALVDGVPQVAFGIATGNTGEVGVPWLLSTPEIKQWSTRFLLMSAKVVDMWKRDHKILTNMTDARHEEAHKWLKWLGFEFVEVIEQYGHEKRPFWRFQHV